MEHLLPPGVPAPIVIPYVCTEENLYDYGDFLEFPSRKGWDFSEWVPAVNWGTPVDVIRWLPDGKSEHDLAVILQSWLFFGLIESTASVMMSKIELRDFIRADHDGSSWITTASLPRYIKEWELAREKHPRQTWEILLRAIYRNLEQAGTIIKVVDEIVEYGGPKRYHTLRPIHFSIVLIIR